MCEPEALLLAAPTSGIGKKRVMLDEHKHGYCTLCRSRCGTINTVRNDALISIRPDPEHPTGQSICMKGRAAPELVHSPHRLQYPLRRSRPKSDPDPGWVRISWEEALSETAARLRAIKSESGAESVAFAVTTPSGTPLSDSIEWIERFVRLFGSPNICAATEICNWHKDYAHAFTFGCGIPPADYENADLIVLWGHNPTNTWLAQAHAIGVGRSNGARLIVVDPRPTALAQKADVWLNVRPGTDAALALGIIRLLIKDARFDETFVREWTNAPFLVRDDNGLFLRERDLVPDASTNRYMVWNDEAEAAVPYDRDKPAGIQGASHFRLRGLAVVHPGGRSNHPLNCYPAFELLARGSSNYTLEEVERITGVSESALREAAELVGCSERIAYHAWTGLGQHTNATQTERAVATLYALRGSFDKRGGNRVHLGPASQINPVNSISLLEAGQRMKALGLNRRPIGPPANGWVTALDTYRAVLDGEPYKVRAMMAFGTNLGVSQPDTELAAKALQALEFHVHCDLFETPAARYADILLPVNTPWEREGLRIGFEINSRAAGLVQLRQQMVPPRGEARSDCDIVFDLASRLGLRDEFFQGSLEAGWNHILEPLGVTVSELRRATKGMTFPVDSRERKYAAGSPNGRIGFGTETQRVEIYSEILLRHGHSPLPTFEAVPAPGAEQSYSRLRYPLMLSSAKNGYYCHSQHRGLVSLRRRAPDPIVELSPSLAAARQIEDGDWVRVTTPSGEARFVARVTNQLADDLVVAEYGWWQACPEIDRSGFSVATSGNSNFNSLVSAERHDPISGSSPLRSSWCNIERDPSVGQREWLGFKPFRVADLTAEADGVLGIRLESIGGAALPDYRPGQHLKMRVNVPGADQPLIRAYSLTGPAVEQGRRGYGIAVRRQTGQGSWPDGRVSSHLHNTLNVGDIVDIGAPSGTFVLPRRSEQPIVLLAAGVGITPFVSLLNSLPDGVSSPEIWLHYGNRNSLTHAFAAAIVEHQRRLPRLRVVNYYDAPLPADCQRRTFQSGKRIDASVVDDNLIIRRARFYLCGPPAMMDATIAGLVARGVPRFDIFNEVFRSPVVPSIDDKRTYSVTFAKSGTGPVMWSSQYGSLLSFAEKLGISMSSGCRVGQCESCAVTLSAGKVRHLHGIEPEDPACCLACQAVPLEDIVIDA